MTALYEAAQENRASKSRRYGIGAAEDEEERLESGVSNPWEGL
jgi:hypothetical protein